MTNFYLAKVRYTKQLENGTFKRVTEPYLFQGETYTDVEARIYEELAAYIRGEFKVTSIVPYKINEIVSVVNLENPIYKVFVNVQVVTDEEKKKAHKYAYLVESENVKKATESVEKHLSSLLVDSEIVKVEKTEILDIFFFKQSDSETEEQPNVGECYEEAIESEQDQEQQ